MNRRTFEGPMEWEYQHPPPVDHSSPFAKLSQRSQTTPFGSPSKFGKQNPNPFAVAAAARSSPSKQNISQPNPPHTSFFNPQLQNKPSAPQFRNPAFTTPQKRFDDFASECSGIESSPAMTDASDMPMDTPEVDRDEGIGKMTITPSSMQRSFFTKSMVRSRTPGRGEVPRGNRDKIRKRKRQQGDKDVGSVRPRLSHDSDDSDSDWEGEVDNDQQSKKKGANQGWLSGFLGAISKHPNAPAVLSKWLQLGFNLFVLGFVVWVAWVVLATVRSDLESANTKAKAELLAEIQACAKQYTVNGCYPTPPPALELQCADWDSCMHRDQEAIMQTQVSVRSAAEILNEFVAVISWKAWGFVLSLAVVFYMSSSIGLGAISRAAALEPIHQPAPYPSQAAAPPMLTSPHHDPNQAYIWAPISHTPRHVRRALFAGDATDTDNSPEVKAIMPPQTPSGRRSPSKGERGRSPTKARSPSKGY